MKYLLAVSGGVDSMVLFDIFKDFDVVVAHFNHQLRPSADEDEKFVRRVCRENDIRCEVGYLKASGKISEEKARFERYKFLEGVREKLEKESGESVQILTAHHLDDLTETVAINLIRGTGWRGLSPFSMKVYRPFIQDGDVLKPESKADILTYAARNKINFRQDPTNFEPDFLRNRVREKLSTLDPEEHFKLNQEIKRLWLRQNKIREEISEIILEMFNKGEFREEGVISRAVFRDLDEEVALEILRQLLEWRENSLTRPQLVDFLKAIKTYLPEKKFNFPGDRLVTIHKNYVRIQSEKEYFKYYFGSNNYLRGSC